MIPTRPTRCSTRSGLTERDDDGLRLLPDGRPAQIIVETAGESTQETDVLELITDHWRKIGIALFIRTSQRDVFRSRGDRRPDHDVDLVGHRQWRADRRHEPERAGADHRRPAAMAALGHSLSSRAARRATAPDLPEANELVELYERMARSAESDERAPRSGTRCCRIYTDQVFSIGIVNGTLQPVRGVRASCATCPTRRSTASTRPPISASTCRTRSGSTRRA